MVKLYLLFLVLVVSVLPGPARDRIYRCIARNRYRLFGRTRLCWRADGLLRSRLIQ